MITITFSKARMPIYFQASGVYEAPTKAIFETLMTVISMGKIMGKLKIAISPKLLLEREDMAETMVSNEAKPKAPKVSEEKYKR